MTFAEQAFLDWHRSGRLATLGADGWPHAIPVCFARLGDLLYTPIDDKPKGRGPRELGRVRNILRRPEVCLLVDHYEEDWTKLAWLQVRGEASLVEQGSANPAVLAALRRRYPQYQTMELESRPVIAIRAALTRSWAWRGSLEAWLEERGQAGL